VWRDRAIGVIRALVPKSPDGERWFEQLWARKIDERKYELCCIPFTTYDYALGDVVDVGPGDDSTYLIHDVIERSGRAVFRVWMAESAGETWDELQGMLRFRKLLFEFRKPALVAIDVADEVAASDLETELRKFEQAGKLKYERGSHGYQPTEG
jgi:hypothetical protein